MADFRFGTLGQALSREGPAVPPPSPGGPPAFARTSLVGSGAKPRRHYNPPRRAKGSINCGSVSHGNKIQVSWDTSVTKLSMASRPAGLE
jgi:hypothetical protein